MVSDTEIINQIRKLKQIKPDSQWAALTRQKIIGHDLMGPKQPFIFAVKDLFLQYKVAFAGIIVAGFAGTVVTFAQNALPGEPLYAVKAVTDKGIALIAGKDNSAAANLQLAQKRLEEINQIAQKDIAKNLTAANTAKVAAQKELVAMVKQNPKKAREIVKQVSPTIKAINETYNNVLAAAGIESSATSTRESNDIAANKIAIESIINSYEGTVLSEKQSADLAALKEMSAQEQYEQALDFYINSSLIN